MCLKNRSKRALISINNIVNDINYKYCDFIIVEDEGIDNLNLDSFKYKHLISHYFIKTDKIWTKSKLINYGLKKTKTPLCVMWDADFLFPTNFIYIIYPQYTQLP